MPHFFASNLRAVAFPAQSANFKFIFEAKSLRDKSAIIFAESTHSGQKILLSKQEKDGKFLVKFNKHFASHSKEIIKSALKEYADLVGAEIVAHNLNENRVKVDLAYLLGWQKICALLGRKFALGRTFRTCENFGESTDLSLVLSPKFSQDTKFPPQLLEFVDLKNGDSATRVLSTHEANSSIFDEKSGLCSHERGNRTDEFIDEASGKLPDLSQRDAGFAKDEFAMLEIGFGSGRHILHLAQTHPNSRIIGLEIYRPAISQVLRQIELLNLQNLYLASIDARVLFEVLPEKCLDRIFLHFPVPWDKNPQRRVLSEQFLANAMRALKKDGMFELLTDSAEYFSFAKALAKDYKCVAEEDAMGEVVSKYEARWRKQEKVIYRLRVLNSSLGASCALGGNFGEQQTQKSSFIPKISSKYKTSTANTRIYLDSANQTQNAESTLDSVNSQNLMEKISSLRADSQNLRGNPQGFARAVARSNQPPCNFNNYRLPRSHSLARNDNIFLDSSLRKCYAQNDKFGLDSAPFTPKKICKKEYFLHIKNKYIFEGGVVVFASFGAYYAPSSAYFVLCGDEVSTISEIIPTRANIDAVGLFMELCFDN